MKTDPAINSARQAVAPRAIDRELSEQSKRDERQQSGKLADDAAGKRGEKKYDVDRHQQRNRDQKAEKKLSRGADVFEAIPPDLGVAPEKAPHIGREPEAIDAERDQQQNGT